MRHPKQHYFIAERVWWEKEIRRWIFRRIVHPKYMWRFYKQFSLLRMKERFEELEIPLKFSGEDYEWYAINFRHLSNLEKNLDTVIVTIEPFGEYRRFQLEYHRTKLFYQVVLSENIAYAEVEVERGLLKTIGGIWKVYEKEFRNYFGSCIDFMMGKLCLYLPKEEAMWCKNCLTDKFKKEFGTPEDLCRSFIYQRNLKGEKIWVETVCHIFRQDSLHNTYILMYLKDINDQKQKEIRQI